jgi:hypothetical protein
MNPSSDDRDVDEAFEHWNDLAREIGADKPDDSWDAPRPAAARSMDTPLEESGDRQDRSDAIRVETDWGAIAGALGVEVAIESDELESFHAEFDDEGTHPEPQERADFAAEEPFGGGEASRPSRGHGPSSEPQLDSPSWTSLWSNDTADVDQVAAVDKQAALDRLFGADSSKVFEEEDSRPQYFDISEDDDGELAAEVRFSTPIAPPEPEAPTDEDRDSRRHGGRGRRSRSRRRGRRHGESAAAPPVQESQRQATPGAAHDRELEEDPFDGFGEAIVASPGESDFDDFEEAERFDQAGGSEGRRTRHRKVASWKEAVGFIVERNVQNHAKEQPDRHRRRRGGDKRR